MNHIKTGILLAGLTALFMGAGFMLAGEGGMIIALVVAIGMNAFAYWNSDSLVLKMYKAREVTAQSSPGFYGIVEQLARCAELPMPRVISSKIRNPTPSQRAGTLKMRPSLQRQVY